MNEEEPLCPHCQSLGYCQFERKAQGIASRVPPEPGVDEALKAHKAITKARDEAREKMGCPKVNEVNPDYPGKDLL